MATTIHTPDAEPISPQEGFELLDAQAQERLGISGEEFLKRWDAGVYADPKHDTPDVVRVAMLIPLAR